jgi:hypothetical protein
VVIATGHENVRTRNQTRRRPTLRPIENIVNGGDFLEDLIVKKFAAQ